MSAVFFIVFVNRGCFFSNKPKLTKFDKKRLKYKKRAAFSNVKTSMLGKS
jgi:hypothetical protein